MLREPKEVCSIQTHTNGRTYRLAHNHKHANKCISTDTLAKYTLTLTLIYKLTQAHTITFYNLYYFNYTFTST